MGTLRFAVLAWSSLDQIGAQLKEPHIMQSKLMVLLQTIASLLLLMKMLMMFRKKIFVFPHATLSTSVYNQ